MRRKIDEAGVPAGLKLVQEMALRRLLTDEWLNAQQGRNFHGFVARPRQRRKIPALVLSQIGIANDDAAHLAIPQRPDIQDRPSSASTSGRRTKANRSISRSPSSCSAAKGTKPMSETGRMMSRFALERWSFEARAAGMSSDQASSTSRSEARSLRGVSSAGWPRRGRGARAAARPSTSRPLRTVLAAEIDRNGLSSVIGTVAAASMPLVEKSHAHRAYCRSQMPTS